jgi:Flp pilus assembly protein TadD
MNDRIGSCVKLNYKASWANKPWNRYPKTMLNKFKVMQNKKRLTVYLFLIFSCAAVYGQVSQFDFVNLDDNLYVVENIGIQYGITLDGLKWMFQTRYADLWNPLVWLSFMADYELYGLHAGGYHLTNLILHILSTLLLFWLFHRMTGALWKSAFVAAFFALHPLHVESVAWVSERKDVLSAFFWMLTLCFYVVYTEKQSVKRYLLVVFSFVLALLSKPMVVTLPIVMILLDYWPLKRFENQNRLSDMIVWQLKEKLPLLALSAVIVIITLYNPNESSPHKIIPLDIRLANAPVAFVTYLVKTFWPHNMAIFYPFPSHIPVWQTTGAILLIITVTAAVMATVKRLPYIFVGWFWFMIMLIPVIGIIQISAYAMADHYHYTPSLGLGLLLAWGIPHVLKHECLRRTILLPAVIFILIIMSVLSWNQCRHWKDSVKLFSHALRVTENNTMMHNLLGYSLFKKGQINRAIYHYNKAILIAPDYIYAYINRAEAYARQGEYQSAVDNYNKAVALEPDFAEVYFKRGTFYGKSGQNQLAIADFSKIIRLKPHYVDAYNNRGIALNQTGMYKQAIDDFNKAIRLKPAYANAWNNRAFAYFHIGDAKQGCSDARKSCELGNCKILEWAKDKELCH